MKTSNALALALVVGIHVVALAAWDDHLTRIHATAFKTPSHAAKAAPTVVASRRTALP